MAKRTAFFSWTVLGAATALAQIPPTASAPGTPKFDVATIKVVDTNSIDTNSLGRGGRSRATGGPGTSDPGRFSDPVTTMLGMLMKAFGAGTGEILGPAVQPRVGAKVYSVMATMPPETTEAQFQKMYQNLLVERFHLVVHHETRNFPGYELVIDKGGPKLKDAGPQSDDAPEPTRPFKVTIDVGAGNITLKQQTTAQLAEQLGTTLQMGQMIQTQDLTLPRPRVVDKTGLTGRYTFTLEFSQPGPPGFTPAPDSPAADLPDIFVALREKLGLRLNKTQGVPVDVIVVDSVDTVPVEN